MNLLTTERVLHMHAGVKNIHAYSWLAHSRKYLESVERERRHSHAAKVREPRETLHYLRLKTLENQVQVCT